MAKYMGLVNGILQEFDDPSSTVDPIRLSADGVLIDPAAALTEGQMYIKREVEGRFGLEGVRVASSKFLFVTPNGSTGYTINDDGNLDSLETFQTTGLSGYGNIIYLADNGSKTLALTSSGRLLGNSGDGKVWEYLTNISFQAGYRKKLVSDGTYFIVAWHNPSSTSPSCGATYINSDFEVVNNIQPSNFKHLWDIVPTIPGAVTGVDYGTSVNKYLWTLEYGGSSRRETNIGTFVSFNRMFSVAYSGGVLWVIGANSSNRLLLAKGMNYFGQMPSSVTVGAPAGTLSSNIFISAVDQNSLAIYGQATSPFIYSGRANATAFTSNSLSLPSSGNSFYPYKPLYDPSHSVTTSIIGLNDTSGSAGTWISNDAFATSRFSSNRFGANPGTFVKR